MMGTSPRRWGMVCVRMFILLALLGPGVPVAAQMNEDRSAREVARQAVERMGGEAALRGVERVSMQMMTQWQRTSFRDRPYTDLPSFERHRDNRDYTLPAWRNTREFANANVVNVIRDSVAVTDIGAGFQPLSIAYVDEREELFAYTPDRLVLLLLDAPDLTMKADTTLGSDRHRVVSATLADRFQATVYLHAGTGLPTLLKFWAGHPNDYGLVPWGEMEVAVWYSKWRTVDGISIPLQWDIERVGSPYKRMTVLSLDVNPEFAADSFAVDPEVRRTYFETATMPMHETRSVEATRISDDLAANEGFGFPAGAVRLGSSWVLLGAGQAPYNYRLGLEALEDVGVESVEAVIAATAATGDGGIVAAGQAGLPIYVSMASEPFVRRMLDNAGLDEVELRVIRESMSIAMDGEELLVAPVDLPDVPGSVMLHHPGLGWLHLPDALDPLDVRMGIEAAERAGWVFESVGTRRALHGPRPEVR